MTTVTDDFNRTNVSPIDGDWETLGPAGVRLNTNRIDASTGSTICLSGYKTASQSFLADQTSQITNTVVAAFGDFVGVGVRCVSTGGGAGYVAYWDGGNGRVYIQKITAGVATTLTSVVNTWTTNDIIKLQAATNGADCDLTAYKNGVSILTYTDSSSPYTSGQPAIYAFNGNANATKGDDWVGTDAGGGSSPVLKVIQQAKVTEEDKAIYQAGLVAAAVSQVKNRRHFLMGAAALGINGVTK